MFKEFSDNYNNIKNYIETMGNNELEMKNTIPDINLEFWKGKLGITVELFDSVKYHFRYVILYLYKSCHTDFVCD